ncbi:hypothetical protein BHM03_00052330, partial [Ensete ventricosum]
EFRSIFCVPSRKFKIRAIPNVLAHQKPYKNGFTKKYDGHKLCAKSRAGSSFDPFFVHHLENSKYWSFPILAHGKSYKHGFVKNMTVINFARCCVQSRVSIDFSCTVSKIQNIGHSRCISSREVVPTQIREKMQRS